MKSGEREVNRGSGICEPRPRSKGGRARVTCGECDVHGSITIAVSMNVSKPSSYVRAMFSNLILFL